MSYGEEWALSGGRGGGKGQMRGRMNGAFVPLFDNSVYIYIYSL